MQTKDWVDLEVDEIHRRPGWRWVKVDEIIRHNPTGEIRESLGHCAIICEDEGETEPNYFNWERGNASCDCNRRARFMEAGGEEDPEDNECSDGFYSVNLRNPATGEIIYREFE